MAAITIAAIITIIMLVYQNNDRKKTAVHIESFETAQGWGYDIMVGDKIVIHQPMIPGRVGNQGFATKQAADSAASVVLEKIKAHKWP